MRVGICFSAHLALRGTTTIVICARFTNPDTTIAATAGAERGSRCTTLCARGPFVIPLTFAAHPQGGHAGWSSRPRGTTLAAGGTTVIVPFTLGAHPQGWNLRSTSIASIATMTTERRRLTCRPRAVAHLARRITLFVVHGADFALPRATTASCAVHRRLSLRHRGPEMLHMLGPVLSSGGYCGNLR